MRLTAQSTKLFYWQLGPLCSVILLTMFEIKLTIIISGSINRACMPLNSSHLSRSTEVRSGVGHQHEVQSAAHRHRTHRAGRGRRAAHQEVICAVMIVQWTLYK